MEDQTKPKISASLSLDPTNHSYANSQAPTLKLSIVSHHARPITIYADDLSPALMLTCGAFKITSLTTGVEIKQTVSTHCRIPPPTKVTVPLEESRLHTLHPNTPVTFATPFARKRDNNGGKPLPKGHPDYGNHRNARFGACGVDGLEPGEDYALTLADNPRVAWTFVRWWEYGTKEQVLRPESSESRLDGFKVKFNPGPREAIMVDTSGIGGIVFHCRE